MCNRYYVNRVLCQDLDHPIQDYGEHKTRDDSSHDRIERVFHDDPPLAQIEETTNLRNGCKAIHCARPAMATLRVTLHSSGVDDTITDGKKNG